LVDDFLAQGQALRGLINIVHQSGAILAGAGIVIEKAFQDGGRLVRDAGIEVYSVTQITSLRNEKVLFS
jgi:xanthine phosphoribosyltransferase